jgi:hypothetical protein
MRFKRSTGCAMALTRLANVALTLFCPVSQPLGVQKSGCPASSKNHWRRKFFRLVVCPAD